MSSPETLLQIEVVLGQKDLERYADQLNGISDILSRLDGHVTPVFTDPSFKHGVSESVDGSAKVFETMVARKAMPDLRARITDGAKFYADAISSEDEPEDSAQGLRTSDYILSIMTRESFVSSVNAIDTEGVDERIDHFRDMAGWMIYILDAREGLLVTAHKTAKLVDTVLEGEYLDYLQTEADPTDISQVDIPVITTPMSLSNALARHGLLKRAHSPETALHEAINTAEIAAQLLDTTEPLCKSLDDFKQWIHRQGSMQNVDSVRKFLLQLHKQMEEANAAPNQYERAKIRQNISILLVDARMNSLEDHIFQESVRVLNAFVTA